MLFRIKSLLVCSLVVNIVFCLVLLPDAFWSHRSLDGIYKTKRGVSMHTPQGDVPGIQDTISITGNNVVMQTDFGTYKSDAMKGDIVARQGKAFLVKVGNASIPLRQYDRNSIIADTGLIYSSE